MDAAETARFLASRPPAEQEAKAHVLDSETAAKLRSRAGTASIPDGKPKSSRFPWRKDSRWIEALAKSTIKIVKQAISPLQSDINMIKRAAAAEQSRLNAEIKAIEAEVAELRADLSAATKVRTFEEFDAAGNLVSSTRESTIGGRQ